MTESCLEVWVRREHALRFCVYKPVSQGLQQRSLLLRLLFLPDDLAQYAPLVPAGLCRCITPYARAIVNIAQVARR
jgi:hypothetical protein